MMKIFTAALAGIAASANAVEMFGMDDGFSFFEQALGGGGFRGFG